MDAKELARRCAETMKKDDKSSRMLGISVDVPDAGQAIATMTVRDDMVNGFGVCHGGLVFTLADTAFAFACNGYNRVSVAASANIDFVRPSFLGDTLTATASESHAGRASGVYRVDVSNQHGKLVAAFRGRSSSRDEPVTPL